MEDVFDVTVPDVQCVRCEWPLRAQLRRAAASLLRLLLPRQHQPRRRSSRDPFTPKARFDFDAFGKVVRPAVRMLDNVLDVDRVAAPAAAGRGDDQAPRGARLHRPGRCADHAGAALRHRRSAPHGREDRGGDARRGLRGVGRAGAGERRLSRCSTRSSYLAAPRFASRLPERSEGRNPQARHPQQPPAVDRAHRHDLARLRRQRLERHRAALLLDLPAQEAQARRLDQDLRRRGPRLAAVPASRRRRGEAAAAVRHRAGASPRSTTCAWSRRWRRSWIRRSARRSTCRRTIRTSSSRTSTWRPGRRG